MRKYFLFTLLEAVDFLYTVTVRGSRFSEIEILRIKSVDCLIG